MEGLLSRITIDPNQNFGKPSIRGMRIRVQDVLELLAAGDPPEEVLDAYPDLQPDDIRACIAYAIAVITGRDIVFA
jgi:uncharacterized protein (DUF433 family)